MKELFEKIWGLVLFRFQDLLDWWIRLQEKTNSFNIEEQEFGQIQVRRVFNFFVFKSGTGVLLNLDGGCGVSIWGVQELFELGGNWWLGF